MTLVKICGIKTLSEALAAIDAGADYLGFNFYPKSVRYIEMQACTKITAVLRAEHPLVRLVGVFVNLPAGAIQTVLQTCGLDLAQLHGDEGPELVAELAPHAFKAFRGVPERMDGYIRNGVPVCLVDASVQGAYGGTGATADWPALAGFAQRYALFLAGGLNPDNVAQAVRQVRPWGVDVASGVEASPGEKDANKMKRFVQAVRSVTEMGRYPDALEKR